MTITVRTIPVELVSRFWGFAEPYVKRALDHASGEFTPADIRKLCEEGTLRLWLVFNGTRVVAAATGEIVQYPTMRRLRVVTLGGANFDAWMPALDEAWRETATDFGCSSIEAFVRRGFVPKLTTWQFRQKHVLVVKEVASWVGQRQQEV